MRALLLRFCLRGGALPRFLAAAALVGFSAVGFAAGASAQSPLPPQNFAAEPGDGEITLSWRPPSTENNPGEIFGYRIFSGNLILEIPHLSITSYTLRGLVNYNIGVYTIRAINQNGLGAPAVLTTYSGASAPGAPFADATDHLLRDSSGQVVASAGVFLGIARASPLGSSTPVPTDSWEFEFSAVGNTWTITTNLTATLAALTVSAGLQGGVLHTIRAIAVNLFGKTRGDAGHFTPPLYAGALLPPPQSVRALGTLNNAAQVYIDQPPAQESPLQYGYWAGAFEGGSLVAAATASVGASEFTLPNLPNGVRYRVEVATHLHGQVGLARATAFADMPPAAPANFVAQHTGGGSIRLSWLPAASPIGLTRYALYAAGEVDELGSGVTVVNVSSGFTGGTVGAYPFTLRAFNGRGGGSFAAATAFVLPPQPPQIAVSRAENNIVVAIEPPAGQASLQHGYWAGAYNGGVLVATATAGVSVASLTLRNLQYGVTYRIEAASHLNGQIGLARATASLTMLPAAPANFVGQHIRAGVINFSWQRPVSAVDLFDYVLVSDLGNQIVPAAATTYTYGFNESANPRGVYFFTLFAQSGAGGSAATATVIALSRPQNVIAYGGEGNLVSVTIGPPSGYGHLQHGYWAGAYNGGVLVATATAGVSVTQLTLFNLPNGVAYRVEAAVNLNGHIGLRRAVTDADMPPAAPANFVAQHAGGGAIRLSWLPAASPISLTRYSLYAAGEADELGGGVTVVTVSSSFTGNTVGAYPFTLRAFNGRGSGDFAMATARLLPPPPPLNFTANAAGNNAVSLSWSKNTAGVDPIRYEISYEGALTLNGVTYNGGKGAFTVFANAGPSGQYATVVAGLLGHVPYRFAMRAYARGFGGAIHQSFATVVAAAPVSPPDAPSVFAVAGEGLVSLRLTRRGAPPVESFVVRITNADYLSAWNAGVNIPATQSAAFAVTPLFDIYPPSSGDAYTVIIRANNASGAGMPVTITANPLFGAPAAPETVAAAPLPGAASLRWRQNWNHAGGGFINAYIVSWSSGDQSRIVGGNIISGGATIDAAGNIANDASVLSSLVPANRQLSVAGWRSAVVPMPGNAPVTVAIRAHSRSPYSPQNRQLGAPISVVVTTSPALPININTELVSRDNILGEAVLRIHAGAADTSNYPPYYYRIRHFTVGLADENLVADHTVLLANYAPIAPTVLITLYNLASDVRHEFYGQACQIPNCISRSGSRHIALNLPGRVPLPPQSLVATPGNGYVSLSWLPPSTLNNAGELLGYILHNGGARLDLSNPQATSHVFRNLTNFEDVVFQARAVNAAGAGLGATITARVGAPAPGVPLPDPEGDNYLYDENGQVIASAGVFRGIARAMPVGAPLPVPTDSWEFEFFRTDLAMYWTVTTNLTAAVAALTVSSGLQGGVEHQIRPIAVNRFGKTHGPLLYFTPRKYSGADLPTPLIFPLFLGGEIETHIPDTPYIGIRWRPSTVSSPLNHHYLIEAFSGDNTVTSRVLNRNLVHPELNTPYYPFEYGLQARVELAAYLDGEKGRVTVVTLRTPPTAPFNFSGRYLGQGRISLQWDPPIAASTLWAYWVYWEDDEGISRQQAVEDWITFLTITGFSETPTSRVFRLRAGVVVGGGGVLGHTVSVTVTTPASSPAPRDFSANIADRGVENVLITITWRPPASTDYPPLSYGLWRSNGFSVTLPGDALAYSEIVPYGASYSYTIVAYNGADNNLAFAVATVHTPPGRVGNARVAGIEYSAGAVNTARYSIAFDAAPTPLEWTFYYMYTDVTNRSWVKIPGVPQPTPSYFHTNYRNIDDVYVVSIRAFSAAGGGPMAVLTVGGVPRQNYIYSYSAPSGFTAVFNNGGVEFSWDIGSANLGCFGTYSQFQLNGSAPNSHIANIPCSQFNPATRTHHYTIASPGGYGKGGFRLRSRTYSGNQLSPWVTAFVSAPPAAPVSFSSSPGLNQIALNWRSPASGSQITHYDVFYDNVSISVTPQNPAHWIAGVANFRQSLVVTGLNYDRQYRFTVRAVNAAGAGLSATVTGSPLPLPNVVSFWYRDLTLGGVEVVWVENPVIHTPVLWHELQYNGISLVLGHNAFRREISNLSNGGFHLFTLRLHSAFGAGDTAILSVNMPPGPPKNLTANVGEGLATLRWNAPNWFGNSISYRLKNAGVIGGATLTIASNAVNSFTVFGLSNGGAERFTLWAVSEQGAGETAYLTVNMPPAAPIAQPASGGLNQVTFYWDQSRASATPIYWQELNFLGVRASVGYNITSFPVSGLAKNGATYLASLRAHNAAGAGAYATLTAHTPPTAPVSLTLLAGDGHLTLFWLPPASVVGGSVTAYIGYVNGVPNVTVNGAATIATLTGLTNHVSVTAGLAAQNAVNVGERANFFAAPTDYPPPPAPSLAYFTHAPPYEPDDSGVSVFWSRVGAGFGGAPYHYPIVRYTVEFSGGVTVNGEAFGVLSSVFEQNNAAASAQSRYLKELTGHVPYEFVIRAIARLENVPDGNRYVVGLPKTVTVTPDSKPHTPSVSASGGNGNVTFYIKRRGPAPVDDFFIENAGGGVAVDPYFEQLGIPGITAIAPANVADEITVVFGPLKRDESNNHYFQIRARNYYGDSIIGDANAKVSLGAPDSPASVFVNAAYHSFTLRWWQDPRFEGGGLKEYYFIDYATEGTVGSAQVDVYNNPVTIGINDPGNIFENEPVRNWYSVTITGLAKNGFYTVGIRVRTRENKLYPFFRFISDPPAMATIAPFNLPQAPRELSLAGFNQSVSLAWGPFTVGYDGFHPLLRYELETAGATLTLPGTASVTSIVGLTNGITHSYTMRAFNAFGAGERFTASIFLEYHPPTAPLSLSVEAGNTSLTLHWQTPANDADATITAYILRVNGSLSLTVGGNARALTATTLVNGEYYTLALAAQNTAGIGATATIVGRPLTEPSAPVSLLAQDGDTVITLRWQAPYNGGETITAYIARYSGGGGGGTVTVASTLATLTNIANGDPATIGVFAANTVGEGPGAFVTATAATTPNAPLSLRAQDGDTVITLQWQAPYNGGATILGYIIEHTEGTLSVIGGANLSATLTALANGAPITASVFAYNRVDRGAASAPVTATAATIPDAPLSLQAQDGDTVITLQWQAPYNGGAAITAYVVEHTDGTLSVYSPRATLTGLANGAPITASVYAINRVDRGASSAPVTATAATTPNAPLSLQAEDGDTVITLRWQAPYNGGATILGYVVEHTEGTLSVIGGANLSATLTALANGAPITASVFAYNRVARGAASAPVTATAATIPDAPLSLQAQDGDTVITLQWQAPYNGGAAITAYIVEHTDGTLSVYAPRATLTGLANGAPITASIYAVNRVDRGASSAPVTATAATTPNAPLSLRAEDGDDGITLWWSPPANNGGAAVTGYIVEHSHGALSVASTLVTITGIANGVAITASVYAINRVGNGAASAPVTATAAAPPSAPLNLQAQDNDGVISLQWQAPANDGGAVVTGYIVEHTEGTLRVAGGANLSAALTGLVNGEPITASVYAINRVRRGAASAPITATAATTPNAPAAFYANEGSGVITLGWQYPLVDGGATVTLYLLQHSEGGVDVDVPTNRDNVVRFGLVNGVTVAFTLRAQNRKGLGLQTVIYAAPRGIPGKPPGLTAEEGEGLVLLRWNAAPPNGRPVTLYHIAHNGITQTAAGLEATVSGLDNGVTTGFTLRGQNSVGIGLAATITATPRSVPGEPARLRAFRGNAVVTLYWNAPPQLNGSTVTGYVAQYDGMAQTMGVNVYSLVVSNLLNGTRYAFSVFAQSDRGDGLAATASALPATIPDAPLSLRAQDGNGVVTLSWQAPYNGGEVITAYIARYVGGGGGGAVTVASTVATLTGVANGAPLTASVYAVNAVDRGDYSAPVVATAATTPNAPLSLQAQDGDEVITLQWQAPYNGGATILGYIVEHTEGTLSVSGGANLGVTLTGLVNGAPITASVYAINRVSRGASSAPVTATAATTPNAPLSLQAQDGDEVITLQWRPPYNGGATILGYIVEHTEGTLSVIGGANLSATLTGLVNGAPITASVYAYNRVSRGASSAPVTATAATTPNAPLSLQAQDGDTVITLQWQAPYNGGATILGYIVQHTEGTLSVAGGANLSVTLTGLANGAPITASVYAINRVSRGAYSAPVTATAAATASAPTAFAAFEGDTVVTLRWGAPADDGGAAVTLYLLQHSEGTVDADVLTNRDNVVRFGLVNGVTVAFTLRAINRKGASAPTIIRAAPRGKPGAPASVTATEGAGFVVLQWSAAPPNGRPVTLYHIAHNGVTQTAAGLAATVSALTSGETVAFVLRGQNSVGIGAPATITATPRSVPGLPVGLSATRGDAAVTLAWGAPPPNGSTITGYVAQYNGRAQTLSGAGHVGATLTGLTNGVLYTIGVYAQSDRGNGATAQVTARPARVPFAPLSLMAADGDEVITLQWQAPNNGGEPILQYIVESNGAPTLTLTTTLATLTGLVNGAGLSLQVAASNVVGLGAAGAAVFATAAKTASAPTAFGANEGEGVVTLFWGYPTNDGGATVSLYVMEHRDVGQDVVTVKTPHNNVVRFALQNGVTVAFTLWAQNRKGLSGATVLLAAPRGKPGAPTGITASEGAGVVVLRWNAAAANGRPVTLYYVSYNDNTLTTAGEAATVSNLVNGATVAFTLWAQNSVGIGASATAMAAARSVPSVPSSLQAQRGDGVVTLLWALPADLNGASVTGYVAEYAGESQTLGGNVYSVVVGNLQNGAVYAFSVYAQSDRGDGLPAVASARPARVPFAPLSLTAADGDGVVTLQWQAPNNGGEPITAYVARYAGAGGGAVTVASTVVTLTGLANGAPITASVYALNVVGAGGASPPTTATAARVANAPTNLRVNEGEGVITLLWDSPANGGAAITAYIAAHAGETITANANSVIFANLPSGETLAFSVIALNRKGQGAAALITAAAHGKPGAPASLRAMRGNGLVTLTWNAPTRLNGSQLYGYGVAYNGQTQSVGASATGYTATGLTNGTEYEFSVFAKSDYGDGATATTSAKPATTPATPASLRAYFADSAITLQWALVAGADAGGESVTAYIIRYGANQALTAAATATSAVFANLTNGETIAFSVYAVNTVGESATPATISEYASTTPNAPTGLLAQDGNGVITLQWSAPVNNGGAAITAYIVERAGGALTTGAPAATLTGLTNGEAIAMTVYAVNRAGVGAASAPATATAATTPAAPVSLLAAEGDAEVTLQWGAPANGGAAILGYTLQWLGQSAPAEERSFVVGNLTNGETVRFTVFAHNRKGAGAVATVAAAGRGKPGAPTNITATEGAGFVVLQWSAAPPNGRPVTLYRIAYNGGSVAAAGLSVAISSLTNGEAVAFTLRGQNSVGIGAAATITATPRAAPGAPLNLRAQRGNAVVTLSWSMPGLLNGATITGYVVDYGDAAQTLSGAGRVGVTLFGLLNGVLYNIGVYAQSDRGVGATASVMARPATTPAAPVSLRAADGDGVVTLQWLAPNNGGEPILRYVVESGGAPTLTVATTLATLTGLTNGEPITAGVYAENVEGAGARSASVVATAASAPAAPTAFVAFEGDEVVTLYWGYPANDGGASVTAYLLEHQGLSVLTQHDNVTRFALENGVTVAFTLRAQNRKGFGEAAVFYAAPRGKPGAPRNLTANEGEMQIILRWDSAPANGREVTLYYIAYNGASITTANDAATISPLTNGVAVAFTLRAQNSVGIGEAATITATPRSVPGAPANLQAQRGNGVVTLLWGAPTDLNGATVTGYVVEYAGLAHTLSAGNTGWTASALQNGTRYAFTVYAQSNLGNGLAAVRRATPATTPAAPFGLAAADGNGVVTLNWQAPNNGGEPITAFVAQYVGGGGGGAATVASTAAVLTGIVNGDPITASIYAVNEVGAGAYSAPIVATAATTPNAPLGLRAGEGEGQVTLFWNAPNNGGAAITAYIASHAGETKTVSGNSAVFAGLTNGETVVFAARAINRKGQSAPASLAAAARGKPGAPTNLLADEGEMQIVLRWSAAAANGAAVTLYRIAYNGQTQTAENLEATIGGLSNGIAVAFTLRGQNSVGIGAAATITATPRTVPGAPANLQAQRGNRAVTLSWGAPAQLNGAAVTGYVVEYAGAAQTLSGGGVTGWVASGLQNGVVYSFTVYAQSDQGAGLAAVASAKPATTPAAPTGLTAADGDTVITLQWLAPASGGEDILEYVAVYIDAGGGGAVTAASTMATLTGLINGEPVIASVYAVNAVGAGAGSSPVAATAARVPSFVLSLRAAEGDTVATLLWNAPQSNGGAAITAYYVVGGGQTLRARQTRATITGLRNGITATFAVRAVNRKGAGAARAVSLAGRGKPDAPANFVAQGADGYAALSWDAAAANGASVTAYLLAHNGATQTIVGLSTTVGGLVNGETTRFTLRAQNSVGIGAAAVAVAAPSGAPGAPTSLRAQRGDSVVRLMWQPPTQLNGATVTGYVVSASHSGGAQTLAATARTAVFGALQNGVDYTFAVYAQSNRGDGAQATAEERPATTPGVPRDITARFGDGEITLQWRAPASNGGEALTAYIVEYNNRVTSFAAGVTVAKIDNLQNGVVFNFSVYAANIVGKGRAAAQVSEYPSGAPPAVLLLTAVFGDGQIALQWRPPPTNNGATITAYYVERLGQPALKTQTTMATVGGLQNGVSYVFFVYGVNRAGEGAVAVIDEYPSAAPASPVNFVAMHEGGTRLTLQWEEPNDNGDDIARYVAHYQGQTLILSKNSRALTLDVAGRGEELAFTLYAHNRAGRGAAAMANKHATNAPSAPVGLQAQRGDRAVTLLWQAPAQINGATISAYIVEYNGASQTAAANAAGITIAALQNGVEYAFAVYASSDNGNGATATANATPMSAPSVPQSLAATRGDAQVSLGWLAPSDNGGSAIAAYIVSWRKDSQQTTPAENRRETTALAITIGALENGEVYWLSVRARNAAGLEGEWTPQQQAKPARAPDAPQNFGYSLNDETAEVTLQWIAPDDGGEMLTAYILHFGSVGAQAADISIRNLPPTQTSFVFAINPNLSYAASIYAVNTAGQSRAAVLRMDGLPSVPQNLTAARGDRQVILNWLAPAYDGGSNIVAYIVSWRKDSQQTTPAGQRRETTALAMTISPLDNGEVYWFSVRARNEATLTGAATPQKRAKPGRAPDAPQNFGYMRNDETAEVTLQWNAPRSNGGEPLTAYILHFGSVGAAAADISVRSLPPTQHSLVLAIDLSLSYAASLYAANTVGPSRAAVLRVNPLNSLEEKAGAAHNAVLGAAAAALAGNWTGAIGRRLNGSGGGGGQGGGGFSFAVPGANFGIGGNGGGGAGGNGANNAHQFAALLRKHGEALAGGDFAAASAINGASFAFAATDANGKPQWDVWGGGGYTDLEHTGNDANWRGRNRSYYGGIDKSAVVKGKQARLGIMFSYDDMDIRMTLDEDAVGYRLHAAGAHPYFSWHFNENTRAYVAAGQGRGEARITIENSGSVTQNLIIRHAAAGLRRKVRAWQDKAGGRVDLGVAADAGFVRADIQGGDGFNSSNLLLSFDAKHRVALAGGEFSQYGKAGFKYEGRPVGEAFGWQASFGGRYAFAAGWSLQSDFNMSHLRARDGSKDRQWGWSGMAELPAAANGGGWSFSLRPAYGATGAGGGIGASGDMAQGLWKQTTPTATASAPRAFSLRSELGYGILGKNALYTPYAGLAYDGIATLRAGIRWEQRRHANMSARANMEVTRSENSAAAAKIRLQANY